MAKLTNEQMEQREQSDACINSAESRQKKAEGQQIEQKKLQLKQLAEEAKQLKDELVEAGAWPLNEHDLDNVAGGGYYLNDRPVAPKKPKDPYDGPDLSRKPEGF